MMNGRGLEEVDERVVRTRLEDEADEVMRRTIMCTNKLAAAEYDLGVSPGRRASTTIKNEIRRE
jgi:hypothetical protein